MDDPSDVEELPHGRWIAQGHVLIWYSQNGHTVSSLVGIGEDTRRLRDVVSLRIHPCPRHRDHVPPAKIHSRTAASKGTVPHRSTMPAYLVSSEKPARKFLLRGYQCRSTLSAIPTRRARRVPHRRPAARATLLGASACEARLRLPSCDRAADGGEFQLKVSVRLHQ